MEAILPPLQVNRGLQRLLGERVLELDVVEQRIQLVFDLAIGGLALRLFLDQLHLDIAQVLKLLVLLRLSRLDQRDFAHLHLLYPALL